MARLGTPDDVAALVEFLLGPQSSYLTGQNLVLDGGSTLSSAQMDPVLGPLLELFRR
jgi:NAD(P)-dependent dehydrogenase (short-subunit alcohol dehydrogenase family)